MKKFLEDFKKFIKRGNVVDMAVGVAVASAFTAIVTAFTKGFISPLLALLTGESGMEEMKWIIREAVVETVDGVETVVVAEVAILWGAFVQALINFLIVAFALFLVIRIAGAITARAEKLTNEVKNKLSGADEEAEAAAKAAEEAAKAAAEAEAAAKAEAEAAAKEAEKKAQLDLLREIRDLLKEKQ